MSGEIRVGLDFYIYSEGTQVLKAKRSARILLALAALTGTLATILFVNHVSAIERQFGEFEDVIIVSQDIPARTLLTAEALETVRIPKRYLRPGLITDQADAVNRISLVAVPKGEYLTASMLRAESLPAGMRALTMTAGQTVILDGDLRPGDRVDVMASFREDGKDVSRIVVRDLEVTLVSSEGRQKQLTVLASADDAAQLVWMENFGKQVRFIRSRLGK